LPLELQVKLLRLIQQGEVGYSDEAERCSGMSPNAIPG